MNISIRITQPPEARGALVVQSQLRPAVAVDVTEAEGEEAQRAVHSASACAEDLLRAARGEPRQKFDDAVEAEEVVDGWTAGEVIEAVHRAILDGEPSGVFGDLRAAADRAADAIREHEPIVRLDLPVIGVDVACERVRNAILGGLMAGGDRWKYETAAGRAVAALRGEPLPPYIDPVAAQARRAAAAE